MNTNVPTAKPPEDFSLVVGGPLYQMFLRSGIVLVRRRIIAFIVVMWLPLLVLTIAGGSAFGGVEVPFLVDLDVHARFLLAVPLLVGAEVLVHQRIRMTIGQFIDRGIVAPEDQPRFQELIAETMRLRNSVAIEITLILGAITVGYFFWREQMTLSVGTWYAAVGPAGDASLTMAGWWYAFISLNLFRFVAWRWYFRLVVWYVFLWRVARLPLRLNPLHPDRAGGIGFIANSVFAFTPVLLAHTVVLSGVIGGRIWHEGMKLPTFQMEIAVSVVLLMVIVLLPLLFFVPKLALAKREAMREYGLLATQYVDEFRAKWMRGRRPEGEPLVGSGDVQSLADLGGAYDILREMRVLPFDRRALMTLAIMIALPYLPLLLTMIPFEELLNRIIGKLL